MNRLLNYIAASILLTGCSSTEDNKKEHSGSFITTAEKQTPKSENFEKGKVLNNIKCKADTNNNYTLYIPISYNNSPSPVILFFDAHADGTLPIKKYQTLAEKYGFILAGSNNSKNGNSAEVNGAFAGNLLNDLNARLNIDSKRIYTSGFSGGSRVASYMAIFRGGINTVIGCGAGLPNIDKPIENKFNYVGIAGDEDFNYTEMEELEKMFKNSDIEHVFIPFNGRHEWCPAEVMEQAFTWLQLKAMKQMLIPKNDSIVNAYETSAMAALDDLLKGNKEEDAYTLAKHIINFTSGLSTNDKLKTIYVQLEHSPALKKALARKEELNSAEKMLKDQYLNALAINDAAWWTTEVQHLKDLKKYPADQVVMNKRILSFMSLACYMNITQMLRSGQINEVEHYISIYKAIDPENPEGPYLQATLFHSQNKTDKALAELKSAAKLGFKEYDRFTKDFPELVPTKQIESIIAIIKLNATKEQ
ncbi:MAG: hypothetical protein HYU69_04435 [Bacteroidetes bacterium]|nr:hypothetical protein [Bacteroidota bacterium]